MPQCRLHPVEGVLRNAELAHIFTKDAKTFGISGEATFDYGVAFDRSRKVADGRVAGVHFLMKKNKITEIHGYGKFTGPNSIEVDLNEGGTETVEFDNAIIATGSSTDWFRAPHCRRTSSPTRSRSCPGSCPSRSSSPAPARSAWSSPTS